MALETDATEWTEQEEKQAEELVRVYQARFLTKLQNVARLLRDAGYICEEPDTLQDDFGCNQVLLTVTGHGTATWPEQKGIDVAMELLFQFAHEGPGGATGVNFGCNVVEVGGRIVGGLTPFNYTEQVWVDFMDQAAVEERWKLFNAPDEAELVSLVERHSAPVRQPYTVRALDAAKAPLVAEVRSSLPEAKQAIFSWGGDGPGHRELYGSEVRSARGDPDSQPWRWRLTKVGVEALVWGCHSVLKSPKTYDCDEAEVSLYRALLDALTGSGHSG